MEKLGTIADSSDTPFDVFLMPRVGASHSSVDALKSKMAIVCRACFLDMNQSSRDFQEEAKRKMGFLGHRTVPWEELLHDQTISIKMYLSYFQFFEEVNRFGRLFKKEGKGLPPRYPRIKFFRDKMIEHWEEYLSINLQEIGTAGSFGKIWIPYHAGSITRPDQDIKRKAVEDAFRRHGSPCADLEGKWHGEYNEAIFAALGNMEPNFHLARKVPVDLVHALFAYCFPMPVSDVEEYSLELVLWMSAL